MWRGHSGLPRRDSLENPRSLRGSVRGADTRVCRVPTPRDAWFLHPPLRAAAHAHSSRRGRPECPRHIGEWGGRGRRSRTPRVSPTPTIKPCSRLSWSTMTPPCSPMCSICSPAIHGEFQPARLTMNRESALPASMASPITPAMPLVNRRLKAEVELLERLQVRQMR